MSGVRDTSPATILRELGRLIARVNKGRLNQVAATHPVLPSAYYLMHYVESLLDDIQSALFRESYGVPQAMNIDILKDSLILSSNLPNSNPPGEDE